MTSNTIYLVGFLLITISFIEAQVVVRNDENNNFYSVAVPSSQTSFHRYFGAIHSRPELDLRLAQGVPNQNQYLVEQNFAPHQHVPQAVQRFAVSNTANINQPTQQQKLVKFSLSPDVSSVQFSSNGLSYSF